MKKKNHIITGIAFGICGIIFSTFAIRPSGMEVSAAPSESGEQQQPPPQNTEGTRFPVSKPTVETYEDLEQTSSADLVEPENISRVIEYDPETNTYIMRSKVGDIEIGTPYLLSPEEYQNYYMQESLRKYWQSQNETQEGDAKKKRTPFSLTDMNFDLGPAEKIFGPGGVKIKTQGFAEISFGIQNQKQKNPTYSQRNQNKTTFKFDESVQMNVTASVGDKMSFNMNYNTDATFGFDQQQLKLKYEGKDDEIIKYIEAGNVSMATTNSLVKGGSSLFGIRTDLQFGKLKVSALASQQQSQAQSVNMDRGAQMTPFEISIDQYDENRHFFLSQYFYDHYDVWIEKLPYIKSGIEITKVELWVTNKRANYEQNRNVVAFADLGEKSGNIFNSGLWSGGTTTPVPANAANKLYDEMTTTYSGARGISEVSNILSPLGGSSFIPGQDYEKIESARRLNDNEFTINKTLGFISLNTALQPDEILAVAFDYKYNGTSYQVGEFSSDNIPSTSALYVKLLKNTNLSPSMPTWKLMMKNVYSLGAYQIQPDRFMLNVMYQSDTTGVYLNYIPETINSKTNPQWIRLLGVDRLDSRKEPFSDGFFDYVEGYTVNSQTGRIFFPKVEPFGNGLKQAIGDTVMAKKYIFQELYDKTLTAARQDAEKNKFVLRGEYKGSSSDVIRLNGTNIPRGSVTVMSGGQRLVEGSDYTVNYAMGEVRIINPAYTGTPITATYESQSMFNMQRKTLLGLNLSYDFSENFTLGGTIMNLTEKPMTTKVSMGDESVNNLLWGLNTSFKTQSQALTNLIDKLPFVEATAPSQISFDAEFAQLIPGHAGGIKYSYLDDFETTQISWSLMNPMEWSLSSTPLLFSEAKTPGYSIDYGKNRALLSWYNIDNMFTNRNSSITPSHIKNDLNQLSDHRVRSVYQTELFPDRETLYNEPSTISMFNLAYYPKERGPYNLDADNIDSEGYLTKPEDRWGGMMRKIFSSYTDFEKNNFEFIEFWILDPFLTSSGNKGGTLYFNLGDVSEDVLKDGKKFYENGIPADGDLSKLEETIWGYVPKRQVSVYAFDAQVSRQIQDVGLNGLSTEQEKNFQTYKDYVTKFASKLSPAAFSRMEADPFSPLNDPSGDNFHHFRGQDYDAREASILERYKYINGTEGNSTNLNENDNAYSTARKINPDFEDLNEDYTLNEIESYYQYKVDVLPNMGVANHKYIVDEKDASVQLRNGTTATVKWYQFRVPLQDYDKKEGNISDFKSIRFMRTFLTDFADTTVLRFGTFDLVRGEWRKYERDLNNPNLKPLDGTTFQVSSVNIEENGSRIPVNYILPPGISRILDPSQPQLRQNNEQSLSLRLTDLSPGDARAVYKNLTYDMRQYKRMQLFVHAEKFINDTELRDAQLSVFIRLGSDYKNNYYEYEVPLNLTPEDRYNMYNTSHQYLVWPEENMIDLAFEKLTNLKLKRNEEKRKNGSSVTFQTPYYAYDSDKPRNKITVVGNPSLSEVKTIMIGVRNNSNAKKSGEVWVNELRLTDFNEDGGWAARANMNVGLSDIGSVNLGGHIETAGFGGIEQSVSQRRLDDYYMYNVATSVDLGRFLPKVSKISAPFFYSYSDQVNSPKYNPLDGDILLQESLNAVSSDAEKDSIKSFSQERLTNTNLSLSGLRVNIASKNPMPYDPANLSFSYSENTTKRQDPSTAWETTKNYQLGMLYAYSPVVKPFEPFAKNVSKSPFMKPVKAFNLNYLPNSFSFSSDISRSYYEIQLRDMSDPGSTNYENVPISFRKEFYWNRGFDLRWDFARSLKFSFTNTTNARIEEPNVVVNKELYPDQYRQWKDSVWQSIRGLGTPLSYSQSANLTYALPFGVIPVLDWVTSTAGYTSNYTWDKGAFIDEDVILGNTIANNTSYQIDGNFNLEKLYNKIPFLKATNDKFGQSSSRQSAANRTNRANQQNQQKPAKKRIEQQVTLFPDSMVTFEHKLQTKNIRVRALRADSTVYPLQYKKKGKDAILIQNKDSIPLSIAITEGPDPGELPWYKVAQYMARGVMMVRRTTVKYNHTNATKIPGFTPGIGDFSGQANGAPGWDFAFGFIDGYDYLHDAGRRGWLNPDSTVYDPAVFNLSRDFSATMLIEPVKGLKIDLDARWNHVNYTRIDYMYAGMPESRGGNFVMTTIALKSAFQKSNVSNGYASEAFNQFLTNRKIVANRINRMYDGVQYPRGTNGYPGTFDPAKGTVDLSSPEVMVPAFLSAYSVGDPNKMKLTVLPAITAILPNWKIAYDGLSNIPWVKENLKSIVLNHTYRCTYNINSYASYQSWIPVDGQDEMGFISDIQTGNPMPAFQYDIASVSLTESFAPLFGMTVTLKNNVSCTGEYKTTRTLSLNMSSNQIIEALRKEYLLGLGYKILNFNNILKMRPSKNTNHDLTLRGDFSYNRNESIIRKIEEEYSDPVSGNEVMMIKLAADYTFSKALTIRAFFDRQMSNPLVSSTAPPITTSNFGFALRFSLAR